jgi:hypothetical protein
MSGATSDGSESVQNQNEQNNVIYDPSQFSGTLATGNSDANAEPDPSQATTAASGQAQQQFVVVPDFGKPASGSLVGRNFSEQSVDYYIYNTDSKGGPTYKNSGNNTIELREDKQGNVGACTSSGSCTGNAVLMDDMRVFQGEDHSVNKRFTVDGKPAKVYDSGTKNAYDYVTVKGSYSADPKAKPPFVFEYHNNQQQ